jgi:23S rRNA G2069 N7-methylase RlmK/C1962 C5-methylase RlmI
LQALVDKKAVPLCRLGKGKANLFLDGAPIVYGGAVESIEGDPEISDPVVVVDHADKVVGWGVYNPHSMYRVRVLQMAWEVEVAPSPDGKSSAVKCSIGDVIRSRVRTAFELRRNVGGLVGDPHTTTYRLINAEGDRMSGVCVDVYGRENGGKVFAVAVASSAWTQKHRDDIVRALGSECQIDAVVWRVDQKMLALETGTASWVKGGGSDDDANDDAEDDAEASSETSSIEDLDSRTPRRETLNPKVFDENPEYATRIFDCESGIERTTEFDAPLIVAEHGVRYEVDLTLGHKTGFYVDQRENRLAVRNFAKGKGKVLDVCTYTGGFALNAALGGALRVIAVDSSQPALDIAARNAKLNGISDATCSFVKAEAFKHLESLLSDGEAASYDVIILDPPKFAPNAKSVPRAMAKYVGLNRRAMELLKPNGLLVTCSCSGAVTQKALLPEIVVAAAVSAGRTVTLLGPARGAGPDQPLDPGYPEGNYLSVLVYRVG